MKAGWRLRRFADGSALLTRRLGRALAPLDGARELRLLAAGARCGAALWAAASVLHDRHPSPLLLAGGACAWCVAAWRAAQAPAAGEELAEPQDAEPEPVHSDAEIYEGIVDYLRRLIADRNGVHLTEALRGLQEQQLLSDDLSAAAFGRHLQRRGIPVRASLRVAGSVGPGVHRDDLPAAAEPLPDQPAKVAV